MAIKLENYDKGIEELIKIVNTLEKEQLSLEKSIELYKKGMKLHKELVDILEKEEGRLFLFDEKAQNEEEKFCRKNFRRWTSEFRIIMEDFIKLIHNDKSIIETRLNKVYADNNEFEKMCAYSFSVGGKRIRAILLLEAFKICRDISDIAIDFSVALELIHNYSLVHDDLPEMDDDKFRRGVLSVYGKYGQSNAVLVGDELLNNANLIMFKAIKTT